MADAPDGRYRKPSWRQTIAEFPWWRTLGVDWRGVPAEPVRHPSLIRLLGFYLGYWPTVAGIVALIFVSATLGVIPPLIIRRIVNVALPQRNVALLLHLVLLIALVHFAAQAVGLVQTALHSLTLQGVLRDVRGRLFTAAAVVPPERRRDVDADAITGRVINDVGIAGAGGIAGVLTTLIGAVRDLSVLAATATAMFVLDWRLALIVWFVLPPFVVFGVAVGRWTYGLQRRLHENIVIINRQLEGTAAAATGDTPARRGAFHEASNAYSDVSIARRFIGRSFGNLWSVGTALVAGGLWWFGGHNVMAGTLTLGTLLAFIAYGARVDKPIKSLLDVWISLRGVLALADRVFEYLDRLTARAAEAGVSPRPAVPTGLRGFAGMAAPRRWLADLDVDLSRPGAPGRGQLWPTVRRLLAYFYPYWPYWVVVVAMALVAIGGLGQLQPLFQRLIIDRALPEHRTGLLLLGILGILAYPVIHIFTGTASTLGHEVMSNRSLRDLRNDFFDRVSGQARAFFGRLHPSEVTSRGLNDIDAIYGATSQLANITWEEIPVFTATLFMLGLNWRLGLAVLCLIPPFLPWTYLFGRVRYALDRRIYEEVTRMHAAVQGVAAGRPDADVGAFHEANRRLADLGVLSAMLGWAYALVYDVKSLVVTAWLWWVGGQWVMQGALSLGTLLAEQTYAARTENLGDVFGAYLTLSGLAANCDRVFALMDEPPGAGVPDPAPLQV